MNILKDWAVQKFPHYPRTLAATATACLYGLALLAVLQSPGVAGAADTAPAASQQSEEDPLSELLLLYEEKDLVTATKRSTPLRTAPAIATIITAAEIRDMGARNLLDVLRMVPGIGISITENGANMIEVRGIRTAVSEKILLMIDGHSLNKNAIGSALYSLFDTLPVENIKRVEIVRGPGSALYGNSAFLATINVITRDADEIDGVEAKFGGGSFDTLQGNVVGAVLHGDELAASGSLDYSRTSGPRLRVESDSLRTTPYSLAPGSPDLSVRQTDAFLKVIYGDLSFRGHYLTKRKGAYIGLGYALMDENYNDVENYWGELAYNRRITEDAATSLKVYYDHFKQDPLVKSLPNGFTNALGSFPNGKIGKPMLQNGTIGSEFQVDWEPFKGNNLLFGVSYESMRQYDVKRFANFNPQDNTPNPDGVVREALNWQKAATRQIWSLYLQDEWHVLERITLTAGARYDTYSDFGDTVNPRAGMILNLLSNLDLKFLYGQAFRAPSFAELYTVNNPFVNGNSSLKPERIETYEVGLAYGMSRALNMELNYFYSSIYDLITRGTATLPVQYINAGKAETQGVELGLHGRAFGPLLWKATYTWQDPRDADTGRRLPYVPSHRATGSLHYSLTRHLNLHTDLHWTGPRPRTATDTRPEMPDYATVDLAVTARDFFKGMELQVAIHNLFDRRYADPDTSGAARSIPGDFPREGISVLSNLLYRF